MKNKSDLKNRLERKNEAEERLEDLACEASSISNKLNSSSNVLIKLNEKVMSLKSNVERGEKKGTQRSPYVGLLEQAESERRNLRNEKKVLEKRMLSIDEEREALRQVIAECDTGADLNEIKAHQDALQESRDEVTRFQALIDEQEAVLKQYPENDDDRLAELQARREEILANIALGEGEDDSQSLDNVDKEIDEVLNDVDGKQKKHLEQFRNTNQTIKGLRLRLKKAELHLNRLDNLTNEIIEQFLISQAKEISATYMENAKALAQQFSRLKVIDDLLISKTGRPKSTFVASNWSRMYLPSLLTKTANSNPQNILFEGRHCNFHNLKKIETERFKEMGLEEFFS